MSGDRLRSSRPSSMKRRVSSMVIGRRGLIGSGRVGERGGDGASRPRSMVAMVSWVTERRCAVAALFSRAWSSGGRLRIRRLGTGRVYRNDSTSQARKALRIAGEESDTQRRGACDVDVVGIDQSRHAVEWLAASALSAALAASKPASSVPHSPETNFPAISLRRSSYRAASTICRIAGPFLVIPVIRQMSRRSFSGSSTVIFIL